MDQRYDLKLGIAEPPIGSVLQSAGTRVNLEGQWPAVI